MLFGRDGGTTGLDGDRWDAGEIRARGAIVTYLIGEPVTPAPVAE